MRYRPDWMFLAGFLSCFALPLVVMLTPLNPRVVGAVVGLAACVLLALRFAEYYTATQTVGRIGVLLAIASLLLGAVGQIDALGNPLNAVSYPLIGLRWGYLLWAIFYPRHLGLEHASPWVKRA